MTKTEIQAVFDEAYKRGILTEPLKAEWYANVAEAAIVEGCLVMVVDHKKVALN